MQLNSRNGAAYCPKFSGLSGTYLLYYLLNCSVIFPGLLEDVYFGFIPIQITTEYAWNVI